MFPVNRFESGLGENLTVMGGSVTFEELEF